MFSKNRFGMGKSRLFGKKNTASKKHTTKAWMMTNKKRNEQYEQPRHAPHDEIAAGVMMSADSSPTLQTSVSSPNYVDLPDEPRPGKITPSTNTTNSSPSPRATKSEAGGSGGGSSSPEVEEAIEEAVPIVRSTLPSPEPRPQIERNGYGKDHDRVDGNNGIKAKPIQHDVDDDSCLIKCVYFTQQCCECTIV